MSEYHSCLDEVHGGDGDGGGYDTANIDNDDNS